MWTMYYIMHTTVSYTDSRVLRTFPVIKVSQMVTFQNYGLLFFFKKKQRDGHVEAHMWLSFHRESFLTFKEDIWVQAYLFCFFQ